MELTKKKTLETRQKEYLYEIKTVEKWDYREGKFTVSELREIISNLQNNKAEARRQYEEQVATIDKEIKELERIIKEIEADEQSGSKY